MSNDLALLEVDEYQRLAARTMCPDWPIIGYGHGLASESGEFSDVIKKIAWHQHRQADGKLDYKTLIKLIEEAGDHWWYSAAIATRMGFTLSEVVSETEIDEVDVEPLNAEQLALKSLLVMEDSISLAKLADQWEKNPDAENFKAVKNKMEMVLFRNMVMLKREGVDWRIVLPGNIEKLQNKKTGRYKEGFSSEASVNRDA